MILFKYLSRVLLVALLLGFCLPMDVSAKHKDKDDYSSKKDKDKLIITEVMVDFNNSSIKITGNKFEEPLKVTLGEYGDVTRFCTFDLKSDPQTITCTALPEEDGDYLLTVIQGKGKKSIEREYDLTILAGGSVGQQGPPGVDGTDGVDGIDGTNGLSAYEIWLAAGNVGTEADFLASLVGPPGEDGMNGLPGTDGTDGLSGADGVDGATWLTGTSNLSTEGVDGDLYLNSLSGDYFKKILGTWELQGNLKGPPGSGGSGQPNLLTTPDQSTVVVEVNASGDTQVNGDLTVSGSLDVSNFTIQPQGDIPMWTPPGS